LQRRYADSLNNSQRIKTTPSKYNIIITLTHEHTLSHTASEREKARERECVREDIHIDMSYRYDIISSYLYIYTDNIARARTHTHTHTHAHTTNTATAMHTNIHTHARTQARTDRPDVVPVLAIFMQIRLRQWSENQTCICSPFARPRARTHARTNAPEMSHE